MKCWNHWILLVLSLVVWLQPRAESSSADPFKMKIGNTSHGIFVSWEKPDKTKNDKCYQSHVQYRHCESPWQSVDNIAKFSFELPAPDMKKNYAFRIRTRLYCINENWGKWSPEKYWRNDTEPCEAKILPHSIKDYLLVTALPLAALLLLYTLSQEWVRRLVLPIIPDPKHTQERILNIEQFQASAKQWFTSFSHVNEECEIVEIEVAYQREEETPEITAVQSPPKPADAVNHGVELTTNASTNCIYSPDSLENNVTPPCSHPMPGYIVL